MPKSKHGPALFELYGKATMPSQSEAAENGRRPRLGTSQAASAFRATIASLTRILGRDEPDELPDEQPVVTRRAPRPVSPPVVSLESGFLHIALSSRGAGVAAFGLMLIALAAFAAGHWIGHQSGVADGSKQTQASLQRQAYDEIAQARNSKPVPDLFSGVGESPVQTTRSGGESAARVPEAPPPRLTARRGAPTWVKGNTYVVVQSFRGDAQQDALRAQEYLAQHEIDTELVGSNGRGYRLITTQGFNRSDETQHLLADRLLKKVRHIGTAYFDAGGRYKLEGYFATLTTDSW